VTDLFRWRDTGEGSTPTGSFGPIQQDAKFKKLKPNRHRTDAIRAPESGESQSCDDIDQQCRCNELGAMRPTTRQVQPMSRFRHLDVRLARSEQDVALAQALRYRVFYEELGARPSPEMRRTRRDIEEMDAVCDHLLVIDKSAREPDGQVVGTYRLNPDGRRFYSASEYDLAPLMANTGKLLEVGRSCVAADYRRGPVMQRLWAGIAGYMAERDIDILFGCASFQGTDPLAHADALAYLHRHHLAPEHLRTRALDEYRVDLAALPAGERDEAELKNALPPLIKAYLRLGGYIGEGAVIDHQFNTIDVCVVVEASRIAEKYVRFYMPQTSDRKAA
jgi:putative hemolysin